MSSPVLVSFLADLLQQHNAELGEQEVLNELALALQYVGYPADAISVTAPDAVAILEWLDAGMVRSTPEQRAGLSGGFRQEQARPLPPSASLAGTEHG